MENKKINFFAIPVFSFVPTKYKELIKEKGGKIFGALLIAFLIFAVVDVIVMHNGFGEVEKTISDNCPDFYLTGGTLYCDEVVDIDEDGVLIRIDCSTKGPSLDEFKSIVDSKKAQSAIYCGSESASLYSTSNGFQQITYADLDKSFQATGSTGGLNFSKESLIKTILPIIEGIASVVIIIGAFFVIVFHYLLCLILKLITKLVCSIAKKNIEPAEMYRLTVLARFAVYTLIWLVGQFVYVPSSFILGLVITIVYIIVIVSLYKEDDIQNLIENNDTIVNEEVSYVEVNDSEN